MNEVYNHTGFPYDLFPTYILINFKEVYQQMDLVSALPGLPTIDTEVILVDIVDFLYKPYTGSQRTLKQAVSAITMSALRETPIEGRSCGDVDRLAAIVETSILTCHNVLVRQKIYYTERLLYDYTKRRNATTAQFRRRAHICL